MRKMHELIRNNRGVALMMVMLISTIALAVMSTLLYMVSVGTKVSGLSKRFATSLEAGEGAAGVLEDYISARELSNMQPAFRNAISLQLSPGFSNACQSDKLNSGTEKWDSCSDKSKQVDINVYDNNTYDLTFDMGDRYLVYAKIVNTIEGNTGGGSSDLMKTCVVCSNSGEINVVPVSAMYSLEIVARSTLNPSEKAKLSMLYEY